MEFLVILSTVLTTLLLEKLVQIQRWVGGGGGGGSGVQPTPPLQTNVFALGDQHGSNLVVYTPLKLVGGFKKEILILFSVDLWEGLTHGAF